MSRKANRSAALCTTAYTTRALTHQRSAVSAGAAGGGKVAAEQQGAAGPVPRPAALPAAGAGAPLMTPATSHTVEIILCQEDEGLIQ